ncbi:cyclic lactone autoinducer peptide [Paenibacillus cellulosilyticus]|uniref:Cyclic lactone autoinducer peptide n=1 Tax=Paenibacillus cellulosilyticus TaxID=375489 RepID=A0A2V2YGT0_9BACL|nr:cyclic lactone autoinducer peptide [Paenibacillus cellulosilyticus]PWV92036.1 cyclic lactone autoinducer peptide [Paenibacillus cellulosilyticus]QKS46718.1 cyclic lactone autoinducer peptide [Paenibacillus cellulosilyticus]
MSKVNHVASARRRNRQMRAVNEQQTKLTTTEPSAFSRFYARTFVYTVASLLALAAAAVTTVSASAYYIHQPETPEELLK